MTLVLHHRGRKPATHALVIGVGRYPYLEGGSRPAPGVSRWGLGQLSSPPLSATAIADFLVGELDNDQAPLGSVDLLLSPDGPYTLPDGSGSRDVEAATMKNISKAAKGWKARCDQHRDNVALFFFCGHGISRRNLSLLAEDFGDPEEGNVFKRAFDLERTARGMGSDCKARVQCFFADACRSLPESSQLAVDSSGLFTMMETLQRPEDAPLFYATLPKDPAYGQAGDITAYTRALLDGLRGTGSVYRNGRWRVTTGRLAEAVARAMADDGPGGGGTEGPQQRPVWGGQTGGMSVLHLVPGRPQVPVRIFLEPAGVEREAHLSITSKADPSRTVTRAPGPQVWRLQLEWGEYQGSATLPTRPSGRRVLSRDLYIDTPETTDTWEL